MDSNFEDNDDFETLRPTVGQPMILNKVNVLSAFPFACRCGSVFKYRKTLKRHIVICKM